MCEPVSMSMATAGLGIAQSVGGYMEGNAQAKAQTNYYRQNAANAGRAYEIESRSVTDRQMQEQDQAAAKKQRAQREFETVRAQAENKASSAGVSGLNLQALMGDLATQQNERQVAVTENLNDVLTQTQAEKKGQSTNMINRINSVKPGQRPSVLGLGLKIAGNVMSGVNSYMQMSE